MSDEFKLQWSVSLPPSAQYAKGHMMNLRANTVEEMDALLTEFLNSEVIAKATDAAALLVGAQVVVETPASSGASSYPPRRRRSPRRCASCSAGPGPMSSSPN